jgi:hypothetical protein
LAVIIRREETTGERNPNSHSTYLSVQSATASRHPSFAPSPRGFFLWDSPLVSLAPYSSRWIRDPRPNLAARGNFSKNPEPAGWRRLQSPPPPPAPESHDLILISFIALCQPEVNQIQVCTSHPSISLYPVESKWNRICWFVAIPWLFV